MLSNESDVIGEDRDAEAIADTLLNGSNVVLAGPLGSGKSHVVRHVVDLLSRSTEAPLLLRAGGPPSQTSPGALAASVDPRAVALREGRAARERTPIIVIDDAHELDADSIAAVVRAVYNGQAIALFALTTAREGAATPVGEEPRAAQMAIDLWLRGMAERVDLAPLGQRDADALLDVFCSAELDTLTRAAIVAWADGSRMLLRELAAEASRALSQNADPLTVLRETPPRGRLSDAVDAHLTQLAPAELSALAVLGRVTGIARADAVRFLPVTSVDALIATRRVHEDGTPQRRLTANPVLAAGAARCRGPEEGEALLAGALDRMLAPESEWWSTPLAILAAASWLRGSALGPAQTAVSPAVRRRAAVDAARRANDDGEPTLALAFCRWGVKSGESADLLVEDAYAEAIQGRCVDLDALVARLSTLPTESATLLRLVRCATVVRAGNAAGLLSALRAVAQLPCEDSSVASELALLEAQSHAFSMDWERAAEHFEELFTREGGTTSLRLRAASFAALGHAAMGTWDESQRWLLQTRRMMGEAGDLSPVTAADRLWAISAEMSARALLGSDIAASLTRLSEEVDAAAREDDAETRATAGLVVTSAYALLGESDAAGRELAAAVRRARPPAAALWVPFARIATSRAQALGDDAAKARALLDLVDPAAVDGVPLLAHERMIAESCVAAALGRREDAVHAAQSAMAVSSGTPTLLAYDLYRLVALGEHDEAVARIRRLAEVSRIPAVRGLADIALTLASDTDTSHTMAALRRNTRWEPPRHGVPGPVGTVLDRGRGLTRRGGADLTLTRREREIALLVADGLGNREIADRLYLSVRTVESHIYQARGKVGARSRDELGRTVAASANSRRAGQRRGAKPHPTSSRAARAADKAIEEGYPRRAS